MFKMLITVFQQSANIKKIGDMRQWKNVEFCITMRMICNIL